MKRSVLVGSLAFALIVTAAGPASAVLQKDGTQNCGSGYTPIARAYQYGNGYVAGPGGSSYFFTSSTWQVRSRIGPGGYWRAWIPDGVYGGMDNQNTYAYCRQGV